MSTVSAHFDGRVFVPDGPVSLPVGTRVTLAIPETSAGGEPPPIGPEDQEWNEIVAQIRAGEPDPPTVEEAMRQIRMRP